MSLLSCLRLAFGGYASKLCVLKSISFLFKIALTLMAADFVGGHKTARNLNKADSLFPLQFELVT